VRELEGELERAKSEVEEAKRDGDRRLRDVVGEKSGQSAFFGEVLAYCGTALEDLVKSLRAHLARLTIELEQNKALVSELRIAQQPNSPPRSSNTSVHNELTNLRKEVERLDKEVKRLGGIVEEGLDTRRKARGEKIVRMEAEEVARMVSELGRERGDEMERARRDVERRQAHARSSSSIPPPPTLAPSKLRQGLHTAASKQPQLMPPTAQPPTRTVAPTQPSHPSQRPNQRSTPPAAENGNDSPTPASRSSSLRRKDKERRDEGPSSPFPSIRAEDEGEFFAALEETSPAPRPSPFSKNFATASVPFVPTAKARSKSHSPSPLADTAMESLPPQTVLARVLRELEDDFAHYKAYVHVELGNSTLMRSGYTASLPTRTRSSMQLQP